jgi:hypothetical protein
MIFRRCMDLSSLSNMKTKVKNHLKSRLDLVIQMYA